MCDIIHPATMDYFWFEKYTSSEVHKVWLDANSMVGYNVSNEVVQEILLFFAQVTGIGRDFRTTSNSTVFRSKKAATANIRNDTLISMKASCNTYALQFDGKGINKAVLISGISSYLSFLSPLEIMKFKSHSSGISISISSYQWRQPAIFMRCIYHLYIMQNQFYSLLGDYITTILCFSSYNNRRGTRKSSSQS